MIFKKEKKFSRKLFYLYYVSFFFFSFLIYLLNHTNYIYFIYLFILLDDNIVLLGSSFIKIHTNFHKAFIYKHF